MTGRQRRALLSFSAFLAIGLTCALAIARPGGGHSYSGGSRGGSRSGGGGSGDGGDAVGLLFQLLLLCIRYPALGVPILILVVGFLIAKAALGQSRTGWSTSAPESTAATPLVVQPGVARLELDRIRQLDPGFSLVLFEDFAYLLYAALQRARAAGTAALSAYLAEELARVLVDPQLRDVSGIVIGAMRYVRCTGFDSAMIEVELELEANFVELQQSGGTQRYYVVDRMVMTRKVGARSRPPSRNDTLDCPNCGAPLEQVRGTECSYCRQNVGFGRFDWMVLRLVNLTREARGPLLTSDVPERGTELATLVTEGAASRFQQLQGRDPALDWQALRVRTAHIFSELQLAWSGREPLRIRPYVSDNLFQSMYYWIDLYTQARCRNVSEGSRILRIDLANVMSDAHFDALTLRVFATGLDYTLSDDGKQLSGSRTRPRHYSEYWTLIRGTARHGAPRADSACPNCGAPLRIGMAGQCEYCRVKVTSGQFDWVLSRIEQDEAYGG